MSEGAIRRELGGADSVPSRLRLRFAGESLDGCGPNIASICGSPPSPGPRRRGELGFLPPLTRGTPPRDAWLGPGRGLQALHVRLRAPRSAAAALPLPPPPRGGLEAEPQGAGREAWAGRTWSARLAARGKGLREWGRRGADRKARRAGSSLTPGAADLLRGKSRSRVPGNSPGRPPRRPPRPGRSFCPLPAGRRRRLDGTSGGLLEVASPSPGGVPFSASFFSFSSLSQLWASGTGLEGRSLLGESELAHAGKGGRGPGAAEPGSEEGAEPRAASAARREADRDCGLRPRDRCSRSAPGWSGWGRLPVTPRCCVRAAGPALESRIPGCRLLCARRPGQPGCVRGSERGVCPTVPVSPWSGEPETELALGDAGRGPRWDESGGRGLQYLGSWRS